MRDVKKEKSTPLWQAPYDPGKRCTLPRQRTLVRCT